MQFANSNNPARDAAIAGGCAMGVVAVARLFLWGKITSVSGILGGLVRRPGSRDWETTIFFIAGLVAGGALMQIQDFNAFESFDGFSVLQLAIAGFLVGFGSQLANGCTSGHGICGIARLSPRSILAMQIFVATAMATAISAQSITHCRPQKSLKKALGADYAVFGALTTVVVCMAAAFRTIAQLLSPHALEFLLGGIFSLGLGVSGMTKPSKVIGSMDFTRGWDPSAAFAELGALAVALTGFSALLNKGSAAVYGSASSSIQPRKDIDLALVAGSIIFGIGWGLAGICPASALANLGSGQVGPWLFVLAMSLGFKAQHLLKA